MRFFKRSQSENTNLENQQSNVIHHEQQAVLRLSSKTIPSFKQLKYGWRIFSNKEQKIVISLLIASIIIFLNFGITAIYNRTALLPAVGGTYYEGLLQTPQFLNPVLAFSNSTDLDMNRLIFAGLLKYDKNLQLQSDLVENYTISEDQKVYKFTLRDGLEWHDGEPLTAEDVVFTIQTIQDPQFNSPHFGRFRDVLVQQIDEKTIQFTLTEPYAGFLPNMTIGIIPKHIWVDITPANSRLAEANTKPIGAGPYKFSKLQKETDGRLISYTLESFNKYHDHQPYIKTIQFKFYKDTVGALDALQRQNIDGLEFISFGDRVQLSQMKTINYHYLSLPQYTGLFINQNTNDKLATKNVREALAYAINKPEIINQIFGDEAQIIDSPILPGTIGYYPEIKKYDYNPEQARQLLNDANWTMPEVDENKTDKNSGFRTKDDQTLEITLTTVDIPDTISIAESVINAWEDIGIKTNLNIVPRNDIEKNIIASRNYEILLFGEVFGADKDPFPFWHSSKRQSPGVNLTSFANTQADSLLEKARQTVADNERAELYKKFQDILIENMPAIFLYTPKYIYPVSDKIKGIDQQMINTPADRFNDIANWYIKVSRRWNN